MPARKKNAKPGYVAPGSKEHADLLKMVYKDVNTDPDQRAIVEATLAAEIEPDPKHKKPITRRTSPRDQVIYAGFARKGR